MQKGNEEVGYKRLFEELAELSEEELGSVNGGLTAADLAALRFTTPTLQSSIFSRPQRFAAPVAYMR